MRKTLLILISVMACLTMSAQPKKSPRELFKAQAGYIARELALDQEVTAKFTDAFVKCQTEIMSMRPPKAQKADSLTDEAIDRNMRARFDRSRKIVDIREKYYNEYRQFLTPRQIKRVYQLEKESMKHFKDCKDGKKLKDRKKTHKNKDRKNPARRPR